MPRPIIRTPSGAATTRHRPNRRKAPRPAPVQAPRGQRLWLLDVPYGVRPTGAVYDRARKAWVHSGAELPESLRQFASTPYTRLRWLEDDTNGAVSPGPQGVAPRTPRRLQLDGAQAIIQSAEAGSRGFLLTDDVGTGKTLTMWLAARAIAQRRGGGPVLVLVDRPVAITMPHWRASIASVGDGGLRVLICSPDQLPKLLARNGKPGLARWSVIIADEAHLYRHSDTRRVEVFQRIARFTDPHHTAPFLICATATPAQFPTELTYLAPVLAQLHNEPTDRWQPLAPRLADAGIPITKGQYGKWQWSPRAATSPRMQAAAIGHVRTWLSDTTPTRTLHRAAPWGPAPLDVAEVQLTFDQQTAYQTEWAQFLSDLRAAGRRTAAAGRTAAGRAAVLRFRQKASLLRIAPTVDWAAAQVEAGHQVAVSCEFLGAAAEPIAESLHRLGIPVARIYGGPNTGRPAETERLRFQTGQAQVVVFTPTTSLSLHAKEQLADGSLASEAPRVGIMHNVRYSGIAGRQIIGRIHRDHQVAPWLVAYAAGTVECNIAQLMVERFKTSADLAGADSTALRKIAAILGADWLPDESLLASE